MSESIIVGILLVLVVVTSIVKMSNKKDDVVPTPISPKKEESLDLSKMKVAELKSHIKAKGKTKGLPTKKADLISLAKTLSDQEIK